MATGELNPGRGLLPGVPVLLYHGIGESPAGPDAKYWIAGDVFRDQLAVLRDLGCRVRLLTELWRDSQPAPGSVVITFDDGLVSDSAAAFPRLLEAGVRAEFFVNTATVGSPGYLDWARIVEMHRAGMSFQSHAHQHVALPLLSPSALRRQLDESRRLLEDRLGASVEFLGVPYGFSNRRVVEAALECGYRAICTSRSWPARPGAREAGRVAIHAHTSLDELGKLARGHSGSYLRRLVREKLVHLPKQLLLHWYPAGLGIGAPGTNQ